MNYVSVFGAFIIMLQAGAFASNYVPVFFWTNARSENCLPDVPVYPGQYILKLTESEYFRCLQKNLNPSNIRIFLLDELDESDFSSQKAEGSDAGSFHHFQTILASTSSVTLPAVQATDVASFLTATLKESFENAEMSVEELPSIDRGNMDAFSQSVARIDDIIRKQISELEKSGEYIAMLTAESSPQKRDYGILDGASVGRQLLATEDDVTNKTEFINADCIFITFQNVTLYYNKEEKNLNTPKVISSNCSLSNTTRMVKLQFQINNDTSQTADVEFVFQSKEYPVSKRTWWLIEKATVTHSLNKTSISYIFNITEDSYTAPLGWSWVCEQPVMMTYRKSKKDEISQRLQFSNIQMQPFEIKNSTFSKAYDCSGILSAPIWMGTVVSLILAAIFAFGLAVMAGVTTMDRFDDPRGKPLIVHTHESN